MKIVKINEYHKEDWKWAVWEAILQGDIEGFKRLCGKEFEAVSAVESSKGNIFNWGCKEGELEIVKFLTRSEDFRRLGHRSIGIHSREADEGFIGACARGQWEVIKILMEDQDLASEEEKKGLRQRMQSGFEVACLNGHLKVVQELVRGESGDEKKGSLIDIRGNSDRGFREACSEGHFEIVKFLKSNPQWVQKENGEKRQWSNEKEGLRGAVEHGHVEIVDWLVRSKDQENGGQDGIRMQEDWENWMIWALDSGVERMVHYCFEIQKDGDRKRRWLKENESALEGACDNENWEVARWLIRAGVKVSQRGVKKIKEYQELKDLGLAMEELGVFKRAVKRERSGNAFKASLGRFAKAVRKKMESENGSNSERDVEQRMEVSERGPAEIVTRARRL